MVKLNSTVVGQIPTYSKPRGFHCTHGIGGAHTSSCETNSRVEWQWVRFCTLCCGFLGRESLGFIGDGFGGKLYFVTFLYSYYMWYHYFSMDFGFWSLKIWEHWNKTNKYLSWTLSYWFYFPSWLVLLFKYLLLFNTILLNVVYVVPLLCMVV